MDDESGETTGQDDVTCARRGESGKERLRWG